MDISNIAYGAKSLATKLGEPFIINSGDRWSPRGYDFKNEKLEIKVWMHPFDEQNDTIEIKYKKQTILKYDPEYNSRNMYKENQEFEDYISPLAAKSLLKN